MANAALGKFALGSDSDFIYLKNQIDACARSAQSYEFRDCLLLPGCVPERAAVGFWKGEVGYVMYVTPPTAYNGNNREVAEIFRTGRKSFADFADLELFLRGMASPSTGGQAVQRPEWAKSPLTDVDAIAIPDKGKKAVPDFRALADRLGQIVTGQERAVESIAFKLVTHISKKEPKRPLSLIFYGPTGVGKSEMGKNIAPVLNEFCGRNAYQLVWSELNTFTEAHSVYRLTGAPPGYVGYDDKPVLEAVSHNERTVFMFDELEKAHPEILKVFMSILDEGRCAARKEQGKRGRELDFRQCIFLFTSNIDLSGNAPGRVGFGARPPHSELQENPFEAEDDFAALSSRIFQENERARKAFVTQGCLKEIAGRFGGFIHFKPLGPRARVGVIARQIAQLGQEYGLDIMYISPAIVQRIVDKAAEQDALSVRSYTSVIEGYLAAFFLRCAEQWQGVPLRLEGNMEDKQLVPLAEEEGQKQAY